MSALNFNDWDDAPARPATVAAPTRPGPAPTASPAPARAGGPALAPVNAADKRIVGGKTDINQLAPFK